MDFLSPNSQQLFPSFNKEKTPEITPFTGERGKIRYFRKVVKYNEAKTDQLLQKRRYCMLTLDLKNKNPKLRVMDHVLKGQKTAMTLKFENEKVLRQRGLSLQHLTKLQFRAVETDDTAVKRRVDPLRKTIKSLQHLDLNLQVSDILTRNGVKTLVMQSRNHKSLQYLSINFGSNSNITDNVLKILANQIGNNHKSLQHLILNFYSNKGVTDTGVEIFANTLGKNLKALQNLNLNFGLCTRVTENGFKALAEQIENLGSLQHLNLNFAWNKITSKGINILAEKIGKELQCLQRLTLNLPGNQICDTGLERLAQLIGNNLKSLKYLNLNLSSSGITNRGLEIFGQRLNHNLQHLQHLSLNLSSNQITDSGISSLAEHLGKTLKWLQHLNLNVYSNDLSDLGISNFVQHLENNLKHLEMNFERNRLSNEGIQTLAQLIGNNISPLQHLNLSFVKNWNIKAIGVKSLVVQIGSLEFLQHLRLNFGWIDLTDTEVSFLAKSLGKNIRSLNLNFIGNSLISNSGLETLAEQIGNKLKFLQYLRLCFKSHCSITDSGVIKLAKIFDFYHTSVEDFCLSVNRSFLFLEQKVFRALSIH